VVSIKDRDKFKEAIRTKLILEVAGRTPERRTVPVAEKEPRVRCLIGEKLWQDRWERQASTTSFSTRPVNFTIGLPCPFMALFGHGAMSGLSPLCAQQRTLICRPDHALAGRSSLSVPLPTIINPARRKLYALALAIDVGLCRLEMNSD
jgi:hypothetical protein